MFQNQPFNIQPNRIMQTTVTKRTIGSLQFFIKMFVQKKNWNEFIKQNESLKVDETSSIKFLINPLRNVGPFPSRALLFKREFTGMSKRSGRIRSAHHLKITSKRASRKPRNSWAKRILRGGWKWISRPFTGAKRRSYAVKRHVRRFYLRFRVEQHAQHGIPRFSYELFC